MLRRSAMTAGFALALTMVAAPAMAQQGPGESPSAPYTLAEARAQVAATAGKPSPGLIDAIRRDLGGTGAQAAARLVNEAAAAKIEPALRGQLGAAYAGAWVNGPTSEMVVATSDSTKVASLAKSGAEVKLFKNSLATLEAAKATLDGLVGSAPKSVPSWYVDVRTNSVVVLARDVAEAQAFVNGSGVDTSLVRVEASQENPTPLYDVRGGDAYYMGGRCSVGFSVTRGSQGGFATAGHCGDVGTATQGFNRVAQGTFQGSSFPGNDYAWVAVNANWTPTGVVNGYSAGILPVNGSTQQVVGSSICRSGSTTQYRCGTISQHNTSVTYPEGTITGLTRTTVCAEPGDSGGSYISGTQAQGVTSGGSGNCTSGGTTYHQPINEILSVYGLTLVTSGTNPPPTGCTGYTNTYTGSLTSNANAYQPGTAGYSAAAGVHRVCLDAPNGTDYDAYLQRLSGSTWTTVASGTSSGPDEAFTYNGTAGTYRVRVHAYSGSGSYTLGLTRP